MPLKPSLYGSKRGLLTYLPYYSPGPAHSILFPSRPHPVSILALLALFQPGCSWSGSRLRLLSPRLVSVQSLCLGFGPGVGVWVLVNPEHPGQDPASPVPEQLGPGRDDTGPAVLMGLPKPSPENSGGIQDSAGGGRELAGGSGLGDARSWGSGSGDARRPVTGIGIPVGQGQLGVTRNWDRARPGDLKDGVTARLRFPRTPFDGQGHTGPVVVSFIWTVLVLLQHSSPSTVSRS